MQPKEEVGNFNATEQHNLARTTITTHTGSDTKKERGGVMMRPPSMLLPV